METLEGKGLRVNLAKTRMMISEVKRDPSFISGKHPCRVCFKGVGSNYIFCNHCAHWVHERCSGLNRRFENVVNLKCRTCLNLTVANDDDEKVRLGNT